MCGYGFGLLLDSVKLFLTAIGVLFNYSTYAKL